VNIGMEEKPKFMNIGDYWNNETLENIAYTYCISIKISFNNLFKDEGDSWGIRRR
jgi:hypothetical protein